MDEGAFATSKGALKSLLISRRIHQVAHASSVAFGLMLCSRRSAPNDLES